jgi:hypothetical protein
MICHRHKPDCPLLARPADTLATFRILRKTRSAGARWRLLVPLMLLLLFHPCGAHAAPRALSLTQSAQAVDAYDFLEVALKLVAPDAKNPFTDVQVEGEFGLRGADKPLPVTGFCAAADGSLFQVRFMPRRPGDYTFAVTYRQGTFSNRLTGQFKAVEGKRRGLLRIDPAYPFHFLWEGTGEHCYLNGTTAFLLMGWEDEKVIETALERFQRYKINRVRVLLTGRTDTFWSEPVRSGKEFRAILNPWVAERPDDVARPGFDYTRFNLPHWEKFERMLRSARGKDINISVILDWNDTKEHTAPGSEDERRYYRYAAARLGAFANVTWDLGDDLDSFRDETWTRAAGTYLMSVDPYRHLATSHPVKNEHQDRTAEWFGMTSFQQWPRPLHEWMLQQRQAQAKTGHIIPQMNEEYGYEDHYPVWNTMVPAPGCSADANRRAAWEMAMAGTYQTTGETAKRGTGVPPDTGGGWINGRADETMLLLELQAHLVDFFTGFEWWKAEPHDELVDKGAFCLAEPAKVYAVYLPHGGKVTVKLDPGRYRAQWFQARSGERIDLGVVSGPAWTSPAARDLDDWALLLKHE